MKLSRTLSKELTLITMLEYPSRRVASKKSFINRATIGVGGNVSSEAEVLRRLKQLDIFFRRSVFLEVKAKAPILKNPPFGYMKQNDFYNSVIIAKTSLGALAFLKFLLRVEKRFKRKRSFKDAPRTLDLDLIFFNNQKMHHKDLVLPHPHWSERESVTIPLKYLQNQEKRRR